MRLPVSLPLPERAQTAHRWVGGWLKEDCPLKTDGSVLRHLKEESSSLGIRRVDLFCPILALRRTAADRERARRKAG